MSHKLNLADRISRWRDEECGEETDDFIRLLEESEHELRQLMKDKTHVDHIAEAIAKICGTATDQMSFNWQLVHAVQDMAMQRDYHKERAEQTPCTFVRRTFEEMKAASHVENIQGNINDEIVIIWKAEAEAHLWMQQMAHRGMGNAYCLDSRRLMSMRSERVEAESWWHLCAKLGLEEPIARLLFYKVKE